jgi:YegS/Rv2252/BmrU family lipid kinase
MTRSPRRALVIINPLSGAGRHESQISAHIALAREVLGAHDIEAIIRPTAKAGDAHAFAREAVDDGVELVVAWGGDGTVNETACALVHGPIPLAIVPAGSGNGLASDLLIPFDARAALRIAATGRTMVIDAGRVDQCLFFNIAGVGIDAVIAAKFNERGLRRRGLRAYLQLSGAELLRYRGQRYNLLIDEEPIVREAMLIAMANGRQYGNRLLIAPGARLDDGLLEVVIVDPLSLPTIAWRLPSLFRGTLRAGNGVTMRAARTLRIESEEAIPFHVDGEPRLAARMLDVTALPHALHVRAPAAGGPAKPL